jgi:hypothetical protein
MSSPRASTSPSRPHSSKEMIRPRRCKRHVANEIAANETRWSVMEAKHKMKYLGVQRCRGRGRPAACFMCSHGTITLLLFACAHWVGSGRVASVRPRTGSLATLANRAAEVVLRNAAAKSADAVLSTATADGRALHSRTSGLAANGSRRIPSVISVAARWRGLATQ